MRSVHLLWAKNRQTREEIDIQGLFNNYWNSNEREFLVSSESRSPPCPLTSDREAQGSFSLESIVVLWYYNSLQTLLFVALQSPIPTN